MKKKNTSLLFFFFALSCFLFSQIAFASKNPEIIGCRRDGIAWSFVFFIDKKIVLQPSNSTINVYTDGTFSIYYDPGPISEMLIEFNFSEDRKNMTSYFVSRVDKKNKSISGSYACRSV